MEGVSERDDAFNCRLFVGVGHGFVGTTIYTAEVSSKELRGSLSIFEGVFRSIGLILVYGFGAILPWYKIAYFAPVFPLLAFIFLLKSPESPVYLVNRGKFEEAEKSLKLLKHNKYDVKDEIKNITEGLIKNKQTKYGTVVDKLDKHLKVKKPFAIVMMLSLIQQFSGASVIRGYVVKIFGKVFFKPGQNLCAMNLTNFCDCDNVSTVSQSANIAAIIIAVVRLLSSLILARLLVKFPRRTLYTASAAGTIFSLLLFATILFISDHLNSWHIENNEDLLNWLTVMSACFLVFSVNLGVQPMPLLMSSELFPAEVRAFCKVIFLLIVIFLNSYFINFRVFLGLSLVY